MPLSEDQLEDLYKTTLENRQDIGWIRKCLEKNDGIMANLTKRQSVLESEQSILKGKLGSFILVLTFAATLLFNGSLFIISQFRGN